MGAPRLVTRVRVRFSRRYPFQRFSRHCLARWGEYEIMRRNSVSGIIPDMPLLTKPGSHCAPGRADYDDRLLARIKAFPTWYVRVPLVSGTWLVNARKKRVSRLRDAQV